MTADTLDHEGQQASLREHSSIAREFAISDSDCSHSGRVKPVIYGKQKGRTNEKEPKSMKRLQNERQKKDKLIQGSVLSVTTLEAGKEVADKEAEHSGESQTDDTVKKMYGRLAYAGRNMSYRLYHGREQTRSYFASKPDGEPFEEKPRPDRRSSQRQTEMRIAEGVLNRREDSPADVWERKGLNDFWVHSPQLAA